jgi:hypothetical protein
MCKLGWFCKKMCGGWVRWRFEKDGFVGVNLILKITYEVVDAIIPKRVNG